MSNISSVTETLDFLKLTASKHWETLKFSILHHSTDDSKNNEYLAPIENLEKSLDSLIKKNAEYLSSGKVISVHDSEWSAISMAYEIHKKHLTHVMDVMRLNNMPSELIVNVEDDIRKNFKNVDNLIEFLKKQELAFFMQ